MKVLFVCSGNAHRSPLAEALLKKLRSDLEVDSAGLQVSIPIAEQARSFLARRGADHHLKRNPESLSSKILGNYDLIVAMQQKHKDAVLGRCQECAARIIVWDIEDPYFLEAEKAEKVYRQIEENVIELARSLENCS